MEYLLESWLKAKRGKNMQTAWADWIIGLEGLGYSDSTTIWRAQFGSGAAEFASSIPHGIRLLTLSGELARLVAAMNALADKEDTREPVEAIQWAYLYGVPKGIELSGKSQATYYRMMQRGETLIRAEIQNH